MSGYFKPLRRKIGVVTLVVACVFAAAWLRSRVVNDFLHRAANGLGFIEADSANGNLVWWSSSKAQFAETPPLIWRSELRNVSGRYDGDEFHWAVEIMGFAIGEFESRPFPDGTTVHRRLWIIPYRSIVIPLTLLSVWLLLSKPRAGKPQADSLR